ncbi:serine hydrolase domain-containing protein [Kineococcus esterisolvens]|uniref:serine hydrolase domain-containing protein n=1 Tax=Kineococcus sp. SYSU DK016 TaxID=3383137 RepID=UPI003D7E12F1
MTTTKRRRVLAGATAALVCAGVCAGQAATAVAAPGERVSTADRATLQRSLDELTTTGAQGVQVRITEGRRQTVLRSGTADHGGERPVPREGAFRVGSITKTFVATVVLQLVAEGRVELDAPVARYLPGLLPDGDRITVRMLLQHTSGLANYTGLLPTGPEEFSTPEAFEEERYRHHEARDLVALAAAQPLDFEPGTSWSYSNTGYLVAGLLVEEVTGQSWREAVEERVVEPLHLRGTSAPGDRVTLPPPHAHGYARIGGEVVNVTRMNATIAGAAGEVVSTTADLDRFLDALLDGRLLSAAQLAEMKRTTPVSPQYGLGLVAAPLECGVTAWGHDGGIAGYTSIALSTEDTRERVVLSLSTAPDPGEFRGGNELISEVFCG